ncbi:MAG: acetylglutamate kinase [Calditrichota bacterium]|jgi:acetylglutamate kinase
MKKLIITKIGGNVIDQSDLFDQFIIDFAGIQQNKILVHGGGTIATDIARKLGIEPQIIDGRRVTDEQMLQVVVMVYGGLVNKTIVSKLQMLGVNSLGLSGADANIIEARKREVKEIDYGFAGDIESVNTGRLIQFLTNGMTPVIAPLTHDRQGNILNTNADTIAAEIATALSPSFHVTLIYCFDKAGLLMTNAESDTVIEKVSWEKYLQLKSEGIVSKGMIPKMDTAFTALRGGVKKINICHASSLPAVVKGNLKVGTELSL